jgi:hypothetical protein
VQQSVSTKALVVLRRTLPDPMAGAAAPDTSLLVVLESLRLTHDDGAIDRVERMYVPLDDPSHATHGSSTN